MIPTIVEDSGENLIGRPFCHLLLSPPYSWIGLNIFFRSLVCYAMVWESKTSILDIFSLRDFMRFYLEFMSLWISITMHSSFFYKNHIQTSAILWTSNLKLFFITGCLKIFVVLYVWIWKLGIYIRKYIPVLCF